VSSVNVTGVEATGSTGSWNLRRSAWWCRKTRDIRDTVPQDTSSNWCWYWSARS